ncbi:hypothetical protein ABNE99_22675 [Paenibacillus larvae]
MDCGTSITERALKEAPQGSFTFPLNPLISGHTNQSFGCFFVLLNTNGLVAKMGSLLENGCKSMKRCGPVIQVHSFFGFDTFFSSMGEKIYVFLDIYKVIF